jgi:hypothetical protein
MSAAYEIDPIPDVTLDAGDDRVWVEIDFPTRVFISKIIVVRTQGSDAFTVELFNSKRPMEAEDDEDPVSLPDGVPEDVYRVCPPLSSAGTKVQYFSDSASGGQGFSFFSKDAPDATRIQGVGTRKIYMRIVVPAPAGSEQKYCVSLGCDTQVE